MSNVSFKTVVRQRVMGCARSSVTDEGLEDNVVPWGHAGDFAQLSCTLAS